MWKIGSQTTKSITKEGFHNVTAHLNRGGLCAARSYGLIVVIRGRGISAKEVCQSVIDLILRLFRFNCQITVVNCADKMCSAGCRCGKLEVKQQSLLQKELSFCVGDNQRLTARKESGYEHNNKKRVCGHL